MATLPSAALRSGQRVRWSTRRHTFIGAAPMLAADVAAGAAMALVAPPLLVAEVLVVAIIVWWLAGLYSRRITMSVLDDLPYLCLGIFVGLAGHALLDPTSVRGSGMVFAGLLVTAVVARSGSYALVRRLRSSRRVQYPTLLIGAGPFSLALAQRMQEHPQTGLCPVGFLDREAAAESMPAPLLGSPAELAEVIDVYGVTDVVLAYGHTAAADLVDVLRTCGRLDVEIYVVPRLFEMHRMAARTEQVWGLPLERVRPGRVGGLHRLSKRVLDVVLATVALVLLAPVLMLVALAVRIDLGRGVLFRQERVGLDGKRFTVHKFRSMRNPPEGTAAEWTPEEDRMGRVGAFIRRYSLDELPQLIDVLRGDMSMVGPRPERPEYVEQFAHRVPRYLHRHRVPCGLTGLAAVEGLRGDTSIVERVYFDNLYIENWSLWLDVKILARTVVAVLRGTGY